METHPPPWLFFFGVFGYGEEKKRQEHKQSCRRDLKRPETWARLLQSSKRDEIKARMTFSKSAKDKNNLIFNMCLNCRKERLRSLFTSTPGVECLVRFAPGSPAGRLCVPETDGCQRRMEWKFSPNSNRLLIDFELLIVGGFIWPVFSLVYFWFNTLMELNSWVRGALITSVTLSHQTILLIWSLKCC